MDGKSLAGAVPKIRLRINVPESDEFATGATVRSSFKATAGGGECESRSRECESMSLGDDYGEDDATTMGGTFLSPPTTSKRRDGRSGVRGDGMTSATTPTSSERAPSPASKRPRMSNDWVEDEVHPSKVWSTPGGSAGKRMMMSEVMASTMRRALELTHGADDESIMGDNNNNSTGGTGTGTTATVSLLKRTLSGTYDSWPSGDGNGSFGGSFGFPTTERGDPYNHHPPMSSGIIIGLPPSSPSDPAPLHDLRKAALMRSRLLNAGGGGSHNAGGNVGGNWALPPRATRRGSDGV